MKKLFLTITFIASTSSAHAEGTNFNRNEISIPNSYGSQPIFAPTPYKSPSYEQPQRVDKSVYDTPYNERVKFEEAVSPYEPDYRPYNGHPAFKPANNKTYDGNPAFKPVDSIQVPKSNYGY